MARIRAETVDQGTRRVWIYGELGASDLRRLEHACAPALEQYPSPLELRMTAVTHIDDVAQIYLGHLVERGARIVGGPLIIGSDSKRGHNGGHSPAPK